jgi:hypothetical protein
VAVPEPPKAFNASTIESFKLNIGTILETPEQTTECMRDAVLITLRKLARFYENKADTKKEGGRMPEENAM